MAVTRGDPNSVMAALALPRRQAQSEEQRVPCPLLEEPVRARRSPQARQSLHRSYARLWLRLRCLSASAAEWQTPPQAQPAAPSGAIRSERLPPAPPRAPSAGLPAPAKAVGTGWPAPLLRASLQPLLPRLSTAPRTWSHPRPSAFAEPQAARRSPQSVSAGHCRPGHSTSGGVCRPFGAMPRGSPAASSRRLPASAVSLSSPRPRAWLPAPRCHAAADLSQQQQPGVAAPAPTFLPRACYLRLPSLSPAGPRLRPGAGSAWPSRRPISGALRSSLRRSSSAPRATGWWPLPSQPLEPLPPRPSPLKASPRVLHGRPPTSAPHLEHFATSALRRSCRARDRLRLRLSR
mmetsp:Transcript_20489/g.44719  ORF Transcript_20489/g.44719 Transcript_20489/m.44719 type:complete len:348 (+) Transcript_20489:245-1288(+)